MNKKSKIMPKNKKRYSFLPKREPIIKINQFKTKDNKDNKDNNKDNNKITNRKKQEKILDSPKKTSKAIKVLNSNENQEKTKDTNTRKFIKIRISTATKKKMNLKEFSKLMLLLNDDLNIPRRNRTISNAKIWRSMSIANNQRKEYYLNNLADNDESACDSFFDIFSSDKSPVKIVKVKEKNERFQTIKSELIKNRHNTISYFEVKDDSRLILLRPMLKYTLYQKHEKEILFNNVHKMFGIEDKKSNEPQNINININITNQSVQSKSKLSKEESFSDKNDIDEEYNNYSRLNVKKDEEEYNNYSILNDKNDEEESHKKNDYYKKLKEKYTNPIQNKKNDFKDDSDLLESENNEKKPIKRTKKNERGMGFNEFMLEELSKYDDGNFTDDFENTKKEIEKIREIVRQKKEEKKRRTEDWNKKFNLFKKHIQKLKKMDDLSLKYDSIGFIYKIKDDDNNGKEMLNVMQAKRINEFKVFLKKNKEKRNLIDNIIKEKIIFRPSCVFSTQNII